MVGVSDQGRRGLREGGANCLKYLRGCSYGGKLARLGRLACLGEMTFIPRSYGIFYLSSIKKFVMSLKKRLFGQVVFTINSDAKPLCRTNVLILFKENSILPCQAGPLVHVHVDNLHLAQVRSLQNQVRPHLGRLACFSYDCIIFL